MVKDVEKPKIEITTIEKDIGRKSKAKGLILCMIKEIQEECQEESKQREKMMVNSF